MTTSMLLTSLPAVVPGAWRHDGHDGPPFFFPFFPFFLIVPFLFWVLVATGVIGWRRGWWRRGGSGGRSEEQGLRDAYARGEIDEEVYRRRLEVLRETREDRW